MEMPLIPICKSEPDVVLHARLEPAAAHWGRWTEQGIGFLDEDRFLATAKTVYVAHLPTRLQRRMSFLLNEPVVSREQPYRVNLMPMSFSGNR